MTLTEAAALYRIRRESVPIGMGYRLSMFIVTTTKGRKRIGIRHLSAEAACRWVHDQGARHIGGCWVAA